MNPLQTPPNRYSLKRNAPVLLQPLAVFGANVSFIRYDSDEFAERTDRAAHAGDSNDWHHRDRSRPGLRADPGRSPARLPYRGPQTRRGPALEPGGARGDSRRADPAATGRAQS